MALELLFSKINVPFFGNTTFAWISILAITMLSLAIGYFIGGYFSKRATEYNLNIVLIFLSIYVLFLPKLSFLIMSIGLINSVFQTVFISTLLCFAPLAILFGLIPPIIVGLAKKRNLGLIIGKIFSISTLGGILGTLLFGFFIIPELGIKFSTYIISITLCFMPFHYFFIQKNVINKSKGKMLFIGYIIAFSLTFNISKNSLSHVSVLYKNDGLMGQLMVVKNNQNDTKTLFINNISQTFMVNQNQNSAWLYVHRIASIASLKPKKSKILIAGVGGGLLIKELLNLGFEVDAVDLDKRMKYVAKEFFGVSGYRFFADDFRHYIESTSNEYDIIISDVSFGEVQPHQIYSFEAYRKMKKILKQDGFLFVHFPGFFTEPYNMPIKSILKTIDVAGFDVKMLNTNPSKELKPSEFMLFATLKPFNLSVQNFNRMPEFAKRFNFPLNNNTYLFFPYSNGKVLYDDRPELEFLQNKMSIYIRKEGIELVNSEMIKLNKINY